MKILSLALLFSFYCFSQSSYQIGSQWNREAVSSSQKYLKLSKSIASIGSLATGFYIGHHFSKHLLITNNHVCPSLDKCSKKTIHFEYIRDQNFQTIQATVKSLVLKSLRLDLSLLEIQFKDKYDKSFLPTALKLQRTPPQFFTQAVIIGYGIHENPYGVLTYENSHDCKIFSDDGQVKLLADTDTSYPLPYKVYSSIVGCDSSHGDSGSPLFNETSHEVMGLIWTAKYPKSLLVQSENLETLSSDLLWQELTLFVPSFLIFNKIKHLLQSH